MTAAATILVVEDEPDIADMVSDRLRAAGYAVEIAADGPTALDRWRELAPALVILDLGLPGGIDGIEVCRRLQADSATPVLMLTARSDETDIVVGLAVGADDYLTKPFSPREMVARVQAILRRAHGRMARPARRTVGDLLIDEATREVWSASNPVHLTATEFDLLVSLAYQNGTVRTRAQLLNDVWGYRDGSGARTVDSHVRSLRRKLGDDVIRTVHGVGYALRAPR